MRKIFATEYTEVTEIVVGRLPVGALNIGTHGYEVRGKSVSQEFSVLSVFSVANKLFRGFAK
jgi:hypothetical protein